MKTHGNLPPIVTIEGHPPKPGESSAAYASRIQAEIMADLANPLAMPFWRPLWQGFKRWWGTKA